MPVDSPGPSPTDRLPEVTQDLGFLEFDDPKGFNEEYDPQVNEPIHDEPAGGIFVIPCAF